MVKNIGFRFFLILAIVAFFAWMFKRGVADRELELGTDLQGGSELVFRFDFGDKQAGSNEDLLNEAITIIQQRIDGYGLKDIVITPIGDDRFSVQISAKDKNVVESIKGLITVLGKLEFRITVEPSAPNYERYWRQFQDNLKKGLPLAEAATIPIEDVAKDDNFKHGLRWYQLSDRARQPGGYSRDRLPTDAQGEKAPWVLCELDPFDISGDALTNVAHRIDQSSGLGGGWVVTFGVNKNWQGSMADLTQLDREKYMAIVLNGKVDSAPVLKSMLSSSGQISGDFSEDEARALAAVLQAGALRQKPELISESTIAAELAGDARQTGVLSTALGFVLVLLIMAWLYRGPGLLANLALLLNLILLVGVLTWFGAVLTLPGIAGVVLTVGMAVDANILVFERIKEEKAKGRTIAQAIETGYDRALVTIIDSNLTTLITAYFLFQVGSGPVRGFGITLAVGIIASMFTALYVTRTFFAWFLQRGWVTEARMRGEFAPPTIGWMAMKRAAVPASALAIVAGTILYEATPDKKKYDLDFTQGSRLVLRFAAGQDLDTVRGKLEALGRNDPLFRDVAVRVSAEGIGAEVEQSKGASFELRSQEIATEAQIDRFKSVLRTTFEGQLLPGPFKATLQDSPGGGKTGEIYFLREGVPGVFLEEALRQLPGLGPVEVESIPAPAGAKSAFRLAFQQPGEALALNVRTALRNFDLDEARRYHQELADDANERPSAQQMHRERYAQLKDLKAPTDENYFEQCDPLPFADRIDPFTAREHRDAAVRAVALSILGIILYVAFRFRSWAFGFAAVIALVHDVLVVLGIVAVVNWIGLADARLNLVTVAAFLTLIGYSINDTIVVFDRIRENRGSSRSRMGEIIDRSINETLGRTIRTTTTTWVVVVILLVMNHGANSALEGFAFILTVGVIVGTYSSIFIASPTLLYVPWFWDQCGRTGRGLLKKAAPFVVALAALLLLKDYLQGNLVGDWSKLGFFDILLAIPAGALALFLFHFVRFVRRDAGEEAAAA